MAAIGGTLAAASGMMATAAWQLLRRRVAGGRPCARRSYFLASLDRVARFSMSPIAGAGTCRCGRHDLAEPRNESYFLLYLLLLKATATSFSGLTSLPVVRHDLVENRHVLTDRN